VNKVSLITILDRLKNIIEGSMVSQTQRRAFNPRQTAIVQLVREQGYASIERMAEHFGVSAQTIRRDVIELDKDRMLQRHHGGAGLPAGLDRLDYSNRQICNAAEKNLIGKALAKHIPDGVSLFVDIGTTMEAVARALINHKGLRVITNHMAAASILCENTDFEIILTGGIVRNRDRALTGEATSEYLKRFRVDFAIFGIGSIDSAGQLLDYDYRDVHVSQTVMKISRAKYVAADHAKFHGNAMIQTAHISEIDALFTDRTPPDDITDQINASDVKLHIAPPNDTG